MKSTETVSRIAFPSPFAKELQTLSIKDDDDSLVNFKQGFPSTYSSPSSNNGRYVKREDINSLGKVATTDLFYHKCGGVNSFDKDFCAKIGGYPFGAVLDLVVGNTFNKVVSLVDDNDFDYVEGGVDGVHWALLNTPAMDVAPGFTQFKISKPSAMFNVPAANSYAVLAGTFTSQRSGVFVGSYEGRLDLNMDIGTASSRGLGIIVCDMTGKTSVPNVPTFATLSTDTNWTLVYSTGLVAGISSSQSFYGQVKTVNTTAGTKYAIAYFLYANYVTSGGYAPDSVDIESINLYIS